MKLKIYEDFKKCGPYPPIWYNTDTNGNKKQEDKYNSLKDKIKTQPV